MENSKNKKPNRYAVLATYLVAVVCLLLGMFLPFFGGSGKEGMLALQLISVFKADWKYPLLLSYPVNFLGLGKSVDIMAWITLLYFVVTVFSLLALIPVGIGVKNDSKLATVFAYIVEIAAVTVTSLYVMVALYAFDFVPLSKISYSMLVALGGTLIPLIVLSILNKKATGAAKLFLFLLSAIGVVALCDFALIIPKLANFKLPAALYGNELSSASGADHLTILFDLGFKNAFTLLPDAKNKALLIFCTAAALLVIFNYVTDVIGLSTNAKKAGHIFNLVRYGLEIVVLACLLITVAVCKYKIGLMLIALLAVAVIQIVICVVRLVMLLKKAKDEPDFDKVEFAEPVRPYGRQQKPIFVDPEPDEEEPFEQAPPRPVYMDEPAPAQRPAYMNEPAPAPAPRPEPAPRDKYGFNEPAEQEPVQLDISDIPAATAAQPVPLRSAPPVQANVNNEPQTRIYTINTIYGGPVDDFMRKLTNDERIEFAMTFIEKSKGNIGNIPEYVIGGNNRLFFSSVFIYLGRIRGLISDGLLNKMYKELNMM